MTLSQYYRSRGVPLPSIRDRARLFEKYELGKASEYKGTLDQNIKFLRSLKRDPRVFEEIYRAPTFTERELVIPAGATLGGLAREYKTTIDDILLANPEIKDPDEIFAGAILKIPTIKKVAPKLPPIEKVLKELPLPVWKEVEVKIEKQVANKSLWGKIKDFGKDIFKKIVVFDLGTPVLVFDRAMDSFFKKFLDPVITKAKTYVVDPLKDVISEAGEELRERILEAGDIPTPEDFVKDTILKKISDKIDSEIIGPFKEGVKVVSETRIVKDMKEGVKVLDPFDLYQDTISQVVTPIKRIITKTKVPKLPKFTELLKPKEIKVRIPDTWTDLTNVIAEQISEQSKKIWQEIKKAPFIFPDIMLGTLLIYQEKRRGEAEMEIRELRKKYLPSDPAIIIEKEVPLDKSYWAVHLEATIDSIRKTVDEGRKLGVPWIFDLERGILEMGDLEAEIKKKSEALQKEIEDPLLLEASERILRNQDLANKIGNFLLGQAVEIESFITKPENLTTSELKEFSSSLKKKYGTLDQLRDLDRDLSSYELWQERQKDFLTRVKDAETKTSSIIKKIDKAQTPEIKRWFEDYSKIEGLSEAKKKELLDFYDRNKSKIDELIDLYYLLEEHRRFFETNAPRIDTANDENLAYVTKIIEDYEKLIELFANPEIVAGLESYARVTAKPESELLIALKEYLVNADWLKKNEKDILKRTEKEAENQRKVRELLVYQDQLNDYISGAVPSLTDLWHKLQIYTKEYKDSVAREEALYAKERADRYGVYLEDISSPLVYMDPVKGTLKFNFRKFAPREFFSVWKEHFIGAQVKPVYDFLSKPIIWWDKTFTYPFSYPLVQSFLTTGMLELCEFYNLPKWLAMKTGKAEDYKGLTSKEIHDATVSLFNVPFSPDELKDLGRAERFKKLFHHYAKDPSPNFTDFLQEDFKEEVNVKYPSMLPWMDALAPLAFDPASWTQVAFGYDLMWDTPKTIAKFGVIKPFSKGWAVAERGKWSMQLMNIRDATVEMRRFIADTSITGELATRIEPFAKWRAKYLRGRLINDFPIEMKVFFREVETGLGGALNKRFMAKVFDDALGQVAKTGKDRVKFLEAFKQYLLEPGAHEVSDQMCRFLKKLNLDGYLFRELLHKHPEARPMAGELLASMRQVKKEAKINQEIFNIKRSKLPVKGRMAFDTLETLALKQAPVAEFGKAKKVLETMYSGDDLKDINRGFELWDEWTKTTDEWIDLYRGSEAVFDLPGEYGIRAVFEEEIPKLKGKSHAWFPRDDKEVFVFNEYKYRNTGEVLKGFSHDVMARRIDQLKDLEPIQIYAKLPTWMPKGKWEDPFISVSKLQDKWEVAKAGHAEALRIARAALKAKVSGVEITKIRKALQTAASELADLEIELRSGRVLRDQSIESLLWTDWFRGYESRLSRSESARLFKILDDLAPNVTKKVKLAVSYPVDYDTRMTAWLKEGKSLEMFTKKTFEELKVVSYNSVSYFLAEAGALESLKGLGRGQEFYREWVDLLKVIPESKLTSLDRLDLFIIEMIDKGLDPLTWFAKTFLLHPDVPLKQKKLVVNYIKKLVEYTIYGKRGPAIKRSILDFIEAGWKKAGQSSDQISREMRRLKKAFNPDWFWNKGELEEAYINYPVKLMGKTDEFKIARIARKRKFYLPLKPLPPAEQLARLKDFEEAVRLEAGELAIKLTTLKGNASIPVLDSLSKVAFKTKNNTVFLGSLPGSPSKLTKVWEEQMADAIAKGKFFILGDTTRLDKSFRVFLDNHKANYIILKPRFLYSQKELINEILKPRGFYRHLNAWGIFSDEDMLKILSYAKTAPLPEFLPKGVSLATKRLSRSSFDAFSESFNSLIRRNSKYRKYFSKLNLLDPDTRLLVKEEILKKLYLNSQSVLDNLGVSKVYLKWKRGKVVAIQFSYRAGKEVRLPFVIQEAGCLKASKYIGDLDPGVLKIINAEPRIAEIAFDTLKLDRYQSNAIIFMDDLIEALGLDRFSSLDEWKAFLKKQAKWADLLDQRRRLKSLIDDIVTEAQRLKNQLPLAKGRSLLLKERKKLNVKVSDISSSIKKAVTKEEVSRLRKLRTKAILDLNDVNRTLEKVKFSPIEISKKLAGLERKEFRLTEDLVNVERRLARSTSAADALMIEIYGYPKRMIDAEVDWLGFIEGKKRPTAEMLAKIDNEILSLKTSIKTTKKSIKSLSKLRDKGVKWSEQAVTIYDEKVPEYITKVHRVLVSDAWSAQQTVLLRLQMDLKRVEKIKEIAPAYRLALEKGIIPTPSELWKAGRRNIDDALAAKLSEISKTLRERAKAPLPAPELTELQRRIIREYPDAAKLQPELIKGKKQDWLIKKYLNANFLDPKYVSPKRLVLDSKEFNLRLLEDKKKLSELVRKNRIKAVIDLTPRNDLSAIPVPAKVYRIDELAEGAIKQLTSEKYLTPRKEYEGFVKLRDIFFEKDSILLYGAGDYPKIIRKIFEARYFDPIEKRVLKIAKDSLGVCLEASKKKGVPGYPFLFPRREFSSAEQGILKTWKKTGRLPGSWSVPVPVEEAIEYELPMVEAEKALHDLRNKLYKEEWVLKKAGIIDLSRKKAPLLVQTGPVKWLPSSFYRSLRNAAKNKMEIFLSKEMTSGDLIVKSFLDKEKISYTLIDTAKKKFIQNFEYLDPTYLLSYGRKGLPGFKLQILDIAKDRNRVFKNLDEIKEKIVKDVMEAIRTLRRTPSIMPPNLISKFVEMGYSPREATTQWMRMIERPKIREWWQKQICKPFLELYEKDLIAQGLPMKEIEKRVSRYAQSLKDIDDYVFKWGRIDTIDEVRKKLALKLGVLYHAPDQSYKLFGLPVGRFEKKALNEVLKVLEKASWKIPRILEIAGRPFGWLRSLWIDMVLLYRAGWYLWNFTDDEARAYAAGQTLADGYKVARAHEVTTIEFLKRATGDASALVAEGIGLGKYVRKPKSWNLEAWRKLKRQGMYGVMDDLVGKKQLKELWSMQGKRLADGSILTPSKLSFAKASGLYEVTMDPVQSVRYCNLLPDTTWFQRLRKRAWIIKTDFSLYATATEELRRMGLLHSLLFDKAMSFAKAEAKVKKFMFDYRDVSAVGSTFRRFFPFYTFTEKSLGLYLDMFIKEPRKLNAALAFLKGWNKATEHLPDYYKDRIPLGNGIWWNPHFSILEFLGILRDPVKAMKQFIDSPLRMFWGFSWDPYIASVISALTEKDYWNVDRLLKEKGWTKWEIEQFETKEGIKVKDKSKYEFWYESLLDQVPFVGLFKALAEVDESIVIREISMLQSKAFREWSKFFGINIIKWDGLANLRHIYFDLPPHLRSRFLRDIKAEDPDLYKIWQDYWAMHKFVKAYNLKGEERVEYLKTLEDEWHQNLYFAMEDKVPGSGKVWLSKNPEIKEMLEKRWEESMTPWNLAKKERYERAALAGIIREWLRGIPARWTEEKRARAEIMGLPSLPKEFSKDELTREYFDAKGNLIITDLEEAKLVVGKEKWEEVGLAELDEDAIKNAEIRYLEWTALSEEAREQKKIEDARYYWKWANFYKILPPDIEDLSEKDQRKYWDEANKYFETTFTKEEKDRWLRSMPELSRLYREGMDKYLKTWEKMRPIYEDNPEAYFPTFYAQDKTFQELYFYKYPEKEIYYPFIYKWTQLIKEQKENYEKTGIRTNEPMDYFWDSKYKKERKAYEAENPGQLAYLGIWKEIFIEVEGNPENYFPLFYSQPDWFREKFFERNEDQREYYPFIYKWIKLIDLDQKNWIEKAKRTNFAHNWFWSAGHAKVRALYEKHNPGILKYLEAWEIIFLKTEETPEDYFPLFFDQPKWFQDRFFRNNPEKKVYYRFVWKWTELIKKDKDNWELRKKRTRLASDYFWSAKFKAQRQAYERDNPGILKYLKTWEKIMRETEGNPEKYFELFYAQTKKFRDRFFKKNKEKEVYYPFLYKWMKLIKEDKKQFERTGERGIKAADYFWAKTHGRERALYEKYNPGILEYLRCWQKVIAETEKNPKEYYKIFYSQPESFQERFFRNNPEKRIYYPFLKKFGELLEARPEHREAATNFFWASANKEAREAYDRDNPSIIAYYGFWKRLNSYAEREDWARYWETYWLPKNKSFRTRHWSNNPEAEERMELNYEYFKLPSISFEQRREKAKWLKAHPELKEWWLENLESGEVALRKKLEVYFGYQFNIPLTGVGRSYFEEVRKWEVMAKSYLEKNPEIQLFFNRNPAKYTGQKAIIFSQLNQYLKLDLPSDRSEFLKDNPELKEYFTLSKAPGIRPIIELQDKYYSLPEKDRSAFLDKHPELKEYWEVSKLPYSYFWQKKKFEPYLLVSRAIEECFSEFRVGKWVAADKLMTKLSSLFEEPGISDEGDWLKVAVYGKSMETWISLIERNEFMATYFFRQLPDWVRDRYYSLHPEKKYLSKEPLSRFIEEPLRIWSEIGIEFETEKNIPELAWVYRMWYKYGRNLPANIDSQIRRIMLKHKIWEDRSGWSRAKWDKFWSDRAIKLNEARKFDFDTIPLLRKELEKVVRTFPLRISPRAFPFPKGLGKTGTIVPFF